MISYEGGFFMNQDDNKSFEQSTEEQSNIDESPENTPTANQQTDESDAPLRNNEGGTQKKKGFTWSAFFSGMLGGLVPIVVVVVLMMNNIIPLPFSDIEDSNTTNKENTEKTEVITTTATEDAQASSDISEVSKAVVGVVNLQQRNIWEPSEEIGSGSGIVYKKKDGKAYIVTNEHVVQDAQEVEIVFNDDKRVNARVLGTDKLTDLAVLEIDGKHVDTVANLGSSEDLKVGETVYAIGNPLGIEFANSLTKGIISGLNRSISVDTSGNGQPDWITEVIQTDAAINPGNSGGALVDADGNVIGINSMKVARQAVEGIGFAIPIDSALPIMNQLETNGEVSRPYIGISSAPLSQVPPQYRNQIVLPNDIEGGMVIASVEAGSPADKAGLQQFDIITKINGNDVTSILELRKFLYSEANAGEEIKVELYRDGKKQNVQLKLVKRSV